MKTNFDEAEKMAEEAQKSEDAFEKVTLQQRKTDAALRDLPFISDCYNLCSESTREIIDNLNNCLSVEAAKKLSKVQDYLSFEDFEALLKKEAPYLYEAKQCLTTAALHTFIDFRAGKKVTVDVRVK